MNRTLLEQMPIPLARAYRQMYDHGSAAEAYHFIALFVEPLLKWYGTLATTAIRNDCPQRLAELDLPPRGLSFSLGHWSSPVQLLLSKGGPVLCPAMQPLCVALEELRLKATPEIRTCMQAMDAYAATKLQKNTVLDFLCGCVLYRNRTRAHGAPTLVHQQQFAPLLLAAYESFLPMLDSLLRLRLIYIERAEIVGNVCLHTLRDCRGLFSHLLTQKLTLPKAQALSSQSTYLFTYELQPLVELSPILIRPLGRDAIYFLNSFAHGAEYLSYDGTDEEFHRPDMLLDSLREFFGAGGTSSSQGTSYPGMGITTHTESEDLGFGNLGL